MPTPRPNRLANATSPYLLQHAHNPVDWYPWGPEAQAAARGADKPIFLSVGYSACHWCHVMERESFADPATARLLNDNFVSIKVDREERPDLDEVYMQAVQLFTGGHGGWPMSVFLTPDLEPYFAGTYFPPAERYGMPSFSAVLQSAADAYRFRRHDISATTRRVTAALQEQASIDPATTLPGAEVLDAAFATYRRLFDPEHGGFGAAPKFPHPMGLGFLLRYHHRTGDMDALTMVTHTLHRMARGGIYDQLGGGFHRYSTDSHWLVPHFEKMLYDNALLARIYAEAWQVTGDPRFRRVAEETLAYIERELRLPEGGLASAQDADSEGVEGKCFVWSPEEIATAAGQEASAVLCAYFDVLPGGNFESGTSVLAIPREPSEVAAALGLEEADLARAVDEGRALLLAARRQRVQPARDDKLVVAWNALAVRALVAAATGLDDPRALERAEEVASLVLDRWQRGPRCRTYRAGRAGGPAFLDDHAGLAAALLDLYEATFEARWLEGAIELAAAIRAEFGDPERGGFFYTGTSQERPLARSRHPYDNVTPSGNSLQAANLLRLAALTGESELRQEAERTLNSLADLLRRSPSGMAAMLAALDFALGPVSQVALAGTWSEATPLRRAVQRRFLPRTVMAGWPARGGAARIALLAGREPLQSQAAAYVCRDFSCLRPVVTPEELTPLLSPPVT